MMNELLKYFPNLTAEQVRQFEMLPSLYTDWNSKINVVSRKDIGNIFTHHILHSLAIARGMRFKAGTRILDIGTGGGFPGIPLAIMFPECKFDMIDGTGKKILVANEIAKAIGLHNAHIEQLRGEDEKRKFEFVVSRAVMPIDDLMAIIKKNMSKTQRNALPNGLLCLKGGDVSAEIANYKHIAEITPINTFFDDEWFKEKKLVYIPI